MSRKIKYGHLPIFTHQVGKSRVVIRGSFLISSTSLDLDPVLVVLLVVELRAVVQHQVEVGGRVTLVDAHLTKANTVPFQNAQFNKHLVARCGWKTWSWSPASSLPPT